MGLDYRRFAWPFIGLVLFSHALLGVDAARRLTVTHDEYWHLPVGYLNLQTGKFDYENLNPPLVRMWSALPLVVVGAEPPSASEVGKTGEFGDDFVDANGDRYWFLLTLSRCMTILLSVATGALLAYWAQQLFGWKSACLVAVLWAFSPTVLASATLVTMDVGVTFFFVLTLFILWKFAERPSWSWAIALGFALGLAQLSKFTAVLLIPFCPLLWLLLRWRNESVPRPGPAQVLGQWALAGALCVVTINAGYLFHGSFQRMGDYSFQSQSLKGMLERAPFLGGLPVPLPRDYVLGIDRQKMVMEQQHPVYLDGEWTLQGFRTFYAKALLYKLSHGTQVLVAAAAIFLLFPAGKPRNWRTQAFLLCPVVALFVLGSLSTMQLGLRYVLPVFPLMLLFAAQSAQWCEPGQHLVRFAVVVAAAALLPWSSNIHPHYLAYFNELSGGPGSGHQHLLDSNIDWGQDLRALKEYLDEHQIDRVGLAYFGTYPPAKLGIKYDLPPSRAPKPGWYAISVNYLRGRPHILREADGRARPADFGEFAYFDYFQPGEKVGYTLYVYHLSEEDIDRFWASARGERR